VRVSARPGVRPAPVDRARERAREPVGATRRVEVVRERAGAVRERTGAVREVADPVRERTGAVREVADPVRERTGAVRERPVEARDDGRVLGEAVRLRLVAARLFAPPDRGPADAARREGPTVAVTGAQP